MKLSADYFLARADAAEAEREDDYRYIEPSESLAKSAALAEAQRDAERRRALTEDQP